MATNGIPSPASSAFVNHLASYPAVDDSVSYIKSTQIGQKGIAASNQAYDQIVKPLEPYIAKANGYASPYVAKVDELADSGLGFIDSRFPIVKEPTDSIKEKVQTTVGYPMKKTSDMVAFGAGFANESKDYVFKVYSDEYSKMGGGKQAGVVPAAKASISTSLIISTQLIQWVIKFVIAKKEEAKEQAMEKKPEVEAKIQEKGQEAKEKGEEVKENVEEKVQ